MSNINIEDLKIKIEKFEKNRANQLKANKKYYEQFICKMIRIIGTKIEYCHAFF